MQPQETTLTFPAQTSNVQDELARLAREVERMPEKDRPFIVTIGNKAFFTLK